MFTNSFNLQWVLTHSELLGFSAVGRRILVQNGHQQQDLVVAGSRTDIINDLDSFYLCAPFLRISIFFSKLVPLGSQHGGLSCRHHPCMQLYLNIGWPVSLQASLFLRNFSKNLSKTLPYIIDQIKVICLSVKRITGKENGIMILV